MKNDLILFEKIKTTPNFECDKSPKFTNFTDFDEAFAQYTTIELLNTEDNITDVNCKPCDIDEDLFEPTLKSVKKRLPWLCLLLFMGMGVSAVVNMFESILSKLPIIMCFQSLILDMAGNVGTQSLGVAIRVLAEPYVGYGKKLKLILKEMRAGIVVGLILGLLAFILIGMYIHMLENSIFFSLAVSACLGVAMLIAMTISSLFGTLIPIFFKNIGVDPAVASGPLITTINDLVAVVTYYGLAYFILIEILSL